MDIWMRWAVRDCKCSYCPNPIEAKTQMVMGKVWKKAGENKAMKWVFIKRWHPQCWIDQGFAYLDAHPYRPSPNVGRPRNILPDGVRDIRLKLLRRHASLLFAMRTAMDKGNYDKVLRVYDRVKRVHSQLEDNGGLPEKTKLLIDRIGVTGATES